MHDKITSADRYPKSVYYIIATEAAERFSFYGMRSILATFLVASFFNPGMLPGQMPVAEAKANEATHLFVSLAYALPFLGGLIADWFYGKYRVILYLSLVYCVGHLCLALFDNELNMFQWGLLLVAIGAGGIKSCVTAYLGDQFDHTNRHLMSKVYGWFYFGINTGSILSTVFVPVIYHAYGAAWAFGVPGIFMACSTLIFFSGRKKYVNMPASGLNKNNFLFISLYALGNARRKVKGQSLLDVAKGPFDATKVDDVKTTYNVLAVFCFIPIFWALWDQNLSEWVLQAVKLDRHVLGFEILPEQLSSINTMFMLLFIPFFNYVVYPFFDKIGLRTTPLRRIGAGLICTALSFVIIALLQEVVDGGGHPSVLWQVPALAILAAAEVLISITGLEFAYRQASKSMKSTMIALWLLTTSVGNFFTAMVNNSIASKGFFSKFQGADYYWLFIGILAAFIVVYLIISPRIKERADGSPA